MHPIVLVRHGEAANTIEGAPGGWGDSPLTELGRRQSALVGDRLRRELQMARCHLVASDLPRAWETAQIVGEATKFELHQAIGLRAFNNGVASGMTQEQAARHLKPVTQPVTEWQMYPLAETLRQFYTRTAEYLQDLTEAEDRLLLLVTHRGVIQNAVVWWLRLGAEVLGTASFRCAPASITVLDEGEWGERRVERLNDTSHLYAARLPDPLRLQVG